MKTKLRVVLFCSLILLLFILTTLRALWNAKYSDIPLISEPFKFQNIFLESDEVLGVTALWETWDQWVQTDGTLYTLEQSNSHTMSSLIKLLAKSEIISASPAVGGSQLKISLVLQGGQKAVFRPMRYDRDFVIEERGNKGADRHNGEIAAFHLARILGITRVPPVVGKRLNLEELLHKSDRSLSDTIYRNPRTSNMCLYGVCYYCSKDDPVCANGNILEGSLSLWIPDRYTIMKFKNPCWNKDCRRELLRGPLFYTGPALLDLIDIAVFDFLIGNMDRHHFEMFSQNSESNRILLLDNGKSFGNPFRDDFILLKPLQQLCMIRNSTYQTLLTVSRKPSLTIRLTNSLLTDPISPVLNEEHLSAIDRRLGSALDIIEQCISNHDMCSNPTAEQNIEILQAQIAEASSEDSDLETEETLAHPVFPRTNLPASNDTISSTMSGTSNLGGDNLPRANTSPPEQKFVVNKQRICLLLFTHSIVLLLGLYIGRRIQRLF
ncbi:Glycosaminoglycan xylosylkinase [Oopsacas minuta]|uniref:Glycosaminoglycan xylosylkinase n=1 Tax=Oopsacas minuta TaxID=111878 RepID=A0AAV7JMZ9_9METZ|nr:Glycosaminoglycan xylosylkinase [Oopsacas minuta]